MNNQSKAVQEDTLLELGWARLGDLKISSTTILEIPEGHPLPPMTPGRERSTWATTRCVPARHLVTPDPALVCRIWAWRAPRLTVTSLRALVAPEQERATARTLDDEDVETFINALMKAIAYCRRHCLDPRDAYVEVTGGTVAASYKYAADSTYLRFSCGEVFADRTRARVKGDRLVCRIRDLKSPWRSTGRVRRHGGYTYPLEQGQ